MKLLHFQCFKGLSVGLLVASLSGVTAAEQINIVSMSTSLNAQFDTYGLIVKTDHKLACGSDRVVIEKQMSDSVQIGAISALISGSKSVEIGYAHEYSEYFDACIGDYDNFVGYKEKVIDIGIQDRVVTCATYKDSNPQASSGMYTIDPDGPEGITEPFEAYCDMEFDGGGWTLVGNFKDYPFGGGSTVVPGSNQYYADYYYSSLLESASEGVRFELPETIDILVKLDDLGKHSCLSLELSIQPNLMNSNNYIVWGHHEDQGCDAVGEDYSLIRWKTDERQLEVIGYSSLGHNAYYYDNTNMSGNGIGWAPFYNYGVYNSYEDSSVHIYVK